MQTTITKRKRAHGKKGIPLAFYVAEHEEMDKTDRALCEDYLKRKEAGTLKLINWQEARKQLEL
ncbi:MAG: hypothetical protein IJU98_07120 [Synergistaceae bacterium]|nr:hypothetical protein [Synergistaceae bacterium]